MKWKGSRPALQRPQKLAQGDEAEHEAIVHAIFNQIYVHGKMIVAVETKGEFYSQLTVALGRDPNIKVLETHGGAFEPRDVRSNDRLKYRSKWC